MARGSPDNRVRTHIRITLDTGHPPGGRTIPHPSMRGENEDPMSAFHSDLKRGRFLPDVSYGRLSSRIVRRVRWRATGPGPDVTVQEIVVPGPKGAPSVSLRVFQRTGLKKRLRRCSVSTEAGWSSALPSRTTVGTSPSPASSASPSPRSVTD
jgi:hypothetical protein